MMKQRHIYIVLALCLLISVCALGSRSAYAVCTNPSGTDGAIVYNSSQKIFQYCKGTAWSPMNIQPGTGSGGCASPTLGEGNMVYNTD